ncbi:mitochondrial outer membrane translocase complex, subunit Tom5 [Stachybotrys elegans]|uniref:Mitochondrial outer membrane translocase complex, subunit Tom5 n=1 Tax=Stachybotrys elegans TaxID=80388 RepID=A0A8K0SNA2_9HYPO|nr:mitochondrial outer membrane translocase complex, subunit Tom5 [Stachybotrys elegans]
MFRGFEPPQQSREMIRAMEAEATFTVQQVVATAFMLYLSPFAIDMVSKIW